MTVSSTESQIIVGGDGSNRVFDFSFIGENSNNISVTYTDTSGVQTTLLPSQYLIALNPAVPGALWGIGGTCTYPLSGTAIPAGSTLTIQRVIPLQQSVSISGQGAFNPEVTEQAMDLLEMQIQQVAARGGLWRGTWAPNVNYSFGDFVIDGANGANTRNIYNCIVSNQSATWAADLAAGDWNLAIQAVIPPAALPLSISNGGTGQATAGAALAALGGISVSGNNVYTGSNNFTGGSIAVPTASPGDSTTKAASTSFVATSFAPKANPVFTGTVTATTFAGSGASLTAVSGKQLVGTATNDAALTGNVGEYVSNILASGSAFNLTNNSFVNLTSISLTAGDWDVWGVAHFIGDSNTACRLLEAGLSTVSAAVPTTPGQFGSVGAADATIFVSNIALVVPAGPFRVSLNTTTTYYINVLAQFTVANCAVYGGIFARRVR